MPRLPRLFLPGGIYHVYCRVARGERVFERADEAQDWIDTVARFADAHELTILAWCLIFNHCHLVLRARCKLLWKAMARIQGTFAKNFNRRYGLQGRLWQSRYKARLVLDEHYLAHLFAYVHLNPVAAGMVSDPVDYPWSGHSALIGVGEPKLINVGAALSCFNEDLSEGRRVYQDRLRTVAELRIHEKGLHSLPWWREVREDDQTIMEEVAPPEAVTYRGQPLPPERKDRPKLGFTHACWKSSWGMFHVVRLTVKKRLRAKLKAVKVELLQRRHQPIPVVGEWLGKVLNGYYRYHAIPGNTRAMWTFWYSIGRLWMRTLKRLSQRSRITWPRMARIIDRWLPRPRVLHPYPERRLRVTT